MKDPDAATVLLAWYDRKRRDLPWRDRPTPYETLLSELMLQQTVVATVIPYFQRFRRQFPDFESLAAAPEEDVMQAWAGLGYYRRARNLHAAAREVVQNYGGRLPRDEKSLRGLPGLGEYTAAAVASIAFGVRTFALDGNAARVMARLSGEREAIDRPETRKRLRLRGERLVPAERAGDFAQAVMELGATLCTPRNPQCPECPLLPRCVAHARALTDLIPVRTPRARKKEVMMVAVAARRGQSVLLQKRAEGTLLAGTWSLPFTELAGAWTTSTASAKRAAVEAGIVVVGPRRVPGEVRHVFTHLDVTARVVTGTARGRLRQGGESGFFHPDRLPALSTFSRKLLALVYQDMNG